MKPFLYFAGITFSVLTTFLILGNDAQGAGKRRGQSDKSSDDGRISSAQHGPQPVYAPEVPDTPIRYLLRDRNTHLSPTELLSKVSNTLEAYKNIVITEGGLPWEIVHGVLAFGPSWTIPHPTDSTKSVVAIDYLAGTATYLQNAVFEKTDFGIRGRSIKPSGRRYIHGFEGHPNQFMGYLSEARLPRNYPLYAHDIPNRKWYAGSIEDALNEIKAHINDNPITDFPTKLERTWSLWALINYEDPDYTWKDAHGSQWSISDLVHLELEEGLVKGLTPCGGMHRAYVIALATKAWEKKYGIPPKGSLYDRANKMLGRWIAMAHEFQQVDGGFSGDFLYSNSAPYLEGQRLAANSHILEFLMQAVPDSMLTEQWISNAVEALANNLAYMRRNTAGKLGSVFHGLHALRMYSERITAPEQQ